MYEDIVIEGDLSVVASIDGDITTQGSMSCELSTAQIIAAPAYSGDYTITPQSEAIVLETNGLVCSDNIIINPIPNNYGLITWSGLGIRVS